MVGRQRNNDAPPDSGDTALTDRTPKRHRIRIGDVLPIRILPNNLFQRQGMKVPDETRQGHPGPDFPSCRTTHTYPPEVVS